MEPIINPFWFYGIYVFNNVNFFASLLVLVGIIVELGVILTMWINAEEAEIPKYKRFSKKVLICLLISGLLSVLVPDKTTIEKIVIAKNITPNNIELFGDTVKDSIDYVFEKINTLGEYQKCGECIAAVERELNKND